MHSFPEFAAMTTDMDSGVGVILDEIERLGLGSNTYVIFTSDNGGTEDIPNLPLRGGKRSLYDGGTRVPFIVRGPEVSADEVNHEAIILYDLMPTFAEIITGATNIVPEGIDGVSLLSNFGNKNLNVDRGDKGIYFYFPQRNKNNVDEENPAAAIIKGDYKLHVQFTTGQFKLFHRINDIEESIDVADQFPAIVYKMRLELRDYFKEVGAFTLLLNPTWKTKSGVMAKLRDYFKQTVEFIFTLTSMFGTYGEEIGDADEDGLDDKWEMQNLLTVFEDGTNDPDGDGFTNEEEEKNGTDPLVQN